MSSNMSIETKNRASSPWALTLAFILIAFLANSPLAAQTVRFILVAPAATIDTNFAATAFTIANFPTGYKGTVVTAANAATFNTVAPPSLRHLFTQLQPGTTLRNRVNSVFLVSANRVDVDYYLVDDRTGFTGGTGMFLTSQLNNQPRVWPAAFSFQPPGSSGRWQGVAWFGEAWGAVLAANMPGGLVGWEGVALHETSHTQWVGTVSRWGAINQRLIAYGRDGSHYQAELLGDPEIALNEGLGTFFGYLHNEPERQQLIQFWQDDSARYFVEAQSVLAGNPTVNQAPRTQGTIGSTAVFFYTWKNVPGYFVLNSEHTGTAYNLFFWQYTNGNRDQAFNMILEAAASMWDDYRKRDLFYETNRLALALERYAATPEGQAAKTAGTLTSSLYPFALLDILTHFGMTDAQYQQEYRRNYPDRDPAALADYFTNHRASIRRLVEGHLNASPIEIVQAVEVAHRYCQNASRILQGNGVVAPTN